MSTSAGPAPSPDLAERISAILFDCFGTLVDCVESHFVEAFNGICLDNGLGITGQQLWDRWLAEGRRLAVEAGRNPEDPLAGEEPPYSPYRVRWVRQFEAAFQAVGHGGDAEEASVRLNRLLREARAYPEVAEVLDALRPRYRLGVLSNADEDWLQFCLARNKLAFDTVISSETAAAYKPHPRIFKRASELLGLEPGQVLYVGDSPISDVLGAHAAGMTVAWVNRAGISRSDRTPEPDLEIADLRGLPARLLSSPAFPEGVP